MKLTKVMSLAYDAITAGRYDESTTLATMVASDESMSEAYTTNEELASFKDALTADITESNESSDLRAIAGSASAAAAFNPAAVKFTGIPNKTVFNPADIMALKDSEVAEMSYESFSASDPKALATVSHGFNYGAALQDPFAEGFFPTVLKPVGTQGIKVVLDVDYLQNEFIRDGKGGKDILIPIILTYNDAEGPLSNNSTALTPVSDVDVSNDKYFNKELETTTLAEGTQELVKTAPLVPNEIIPLMQLSQSEADLAKGVMDRTDTLSPDLKLKNVYFQLDSEDINKTVVIDASVFAGSNFSPAPQGDDNGDVVLNLNAKTFAVKLDELKYKDGSIVDDTNIGYTSVFRIAISGAGNLIDDEVSISVSTFVLVDILGADGVSLDPESTVYASIKAVADKFGAVGAFVGYDVSAFLVNDNKRRLGRRITRRPKSENYALKPSAPFTVTSALKGLDARGEADRALIPTLVKDVNKQTSMTAVLTLTKFADSLRTSKEAGIDLRISPLNGVARHVLNPYFVSDNINLTAIVDSQSSSARANDITAALVEKIATTVNDMIVESRYADAIEFNKDTIDVIIGAHMTIARYLPTAFDISDTVKVKVVSTRNTAMKEKMLITFTNHGSDRHTEVDPMIFGNHIYVPTLVADSSDNKIREYFVSPIQTHIVHMPIMAELIVTGISEVTAKLAVWVDSKTRV